MRCSRHLVLCTVHTILQCADWESYLSCSTHIAICLPQHRCLEKLVHDDTTLWLFRIIADETVLLRRYLSPAEQHYDWRLFPWRAFILGSSRRFAVVSELVGHDALDLQTVKVSDDTSQLYALSRSVETHMHSHVGIHQETMGAMCFFVWHTIAVFQYADSDTYPYCRSIISRCLQNAGRWWHNLMVVSDNRWRNRFTTTVSESSNVAPPYWTFR